VDKLHRQDSYAKVTAMVFFRGKVPNIEQAHLTLLGQTFFVAGAW
jgi:hypothetical protein